MVCSLVVSPPRDRPSACWRLAWIESSPLCGPRRRAGGRSEACFAMHAGVPPIPASSGRTDRHRLCRGGNRQLNAAIHRIAITQLRLGGSARPTLGGAAPRVTAPVTLSARSSGASPALSTSSSSSPTSGYERLVLPPLDRGAT